MVLTFTSMMFSSQKQLPGFQRHLFGLLELKNTMMLALFGPGPAVNVDQATTTFWMWKHVSKKTRHLYLQLYILRPWNQCHFGMISIRGAHRSARHFLQWESMVSGFQQIRKRSLWARCGAWKERSRAALCKCSLREVPPHIENLVPAGQE